MEVEQSKKRYGRRGIYLLPNLFTTAGLFAGFYAVVAAMKGLFDLAAIAIFVAMLMDSLDGRVARLTNTQSAFGGEYDSLTDMVAFGVAPPLVAYSWVLYRFGKIGWLIAFLYTAAVALRLARFNTQLSNPDKRYFQGLACTASAGVMAGLVWVGKEYEMHGTGLVIAIALFTLGLSALMISNIRYHSFKELDLRGRVPFISIVILVMIFVCISIDPPNILFWVFFSYAMSGPIMTIWGLRKKRMNRYHIDNNVP